MDEVRIIDSTKVKGIFTLQFPFKKTFYEFEQFHLVTAFSCISGIVQVC